MHTHAQKHLNATTNPLIACKLGFCHSRTPGTKLLGVDLYASAAQEKHLPERWLVKGASVGLLVFFFMFRRPTTHPKP